MAIRGGGWMACCSSAAAISASSVRHRAPARVERQPRPFLAAFVGAEVDAGARSGLRGDDGDELLAVARLLPGGLAHSAQLVLEGHREQQ